MIYINTYSRFIHACLVGSARPICLLAGAAALLEEEVAQAKTSCGRLSPSLSLSLPLSRKSIDSSVG